MNAQFVLAALTKEMHLWSKANSLEELKKMWDNRLDIKAVGLSLEQTNAVEMARALMHAALILPMALGGIAVRIKPLITP